MVFTRYPCRFTFLEIIMITINTNTGALRQAAAASTNKRFILAQTNAPAIDTDIELLPEEEVTLKVPVWVLALVAFLVLRRK